MIFAVPPETRKASPAAPEIEPPFIPSVPRTFVSEIPLPLLPLFVEETLVNVAPKVTPFAAIAGPICPALPAAAIVPVETLIVPPPAALIPVPFEVVSASDAKPSVAPVFVPDQLIPAPPVVVLLTIVEAKLITVPLAAF